MNVQSIAGRIQRFEEELKKPFVGRDEESRVVVLALLTGEHAVLIGEPGCVTGDTIIASEDGKLFYIEDIARGLVPGIYIADFPVFPPGRATELHVYDVWETYEAVTAHGFRVRGTPNHPVLTNRGWVALKDIRKGDKVRIMTQLPSPTQYISVPNGRPSARTPRSGGVSVKEVNILDERLAELLGVFVARGRFHATRAISFEIDDSEIQLHRRVLSLMKDLFGVEPSISRLKRSRIPRLRNPVVLKYSSGYVAELFKSLNHVHGEKRVSPWILLSPKRVSAAFLRGLFEGCGVIGERLELRIRLRSGEEGLLTGVQMLLLRHGIFSRIRRNVHGLCVLSIRGLDNLRRFNDEIGFISEQKGVGLARTILRGRRRSHARSLMWDVVRGVRRLEGWVRVYDFHVPETHSFFTNGILSHNTAKSALVRRAAELLNAKFFKYLLTKYTEPSELFGPLDIKALEEGRYVRLTTGKLPDAQIAFLDEIFKANSAILNALNTLLQERILYDGFTELRVDLRTLFGASNEAPEDPEIQSVYDRFLLRHFVSPVQEDLWRNLLKASWELEKRSVLGRVIDDGGKILCIDDLRRVNESLYEVDLSGVEGKLLRLFAALESRGIHLTDRRKGKSMKVIAASALMNGRKYAMEEDLLAVKYVAVREWDELEKVNAVLAEELKTSFKYLRELSEIKNNLRELLQYVRSLEGVESSFVSAKFEAIGRELEITRARVISVMRESQDPQVLRVGEDVLNLINNVMEVVNKKVDRV